MSAKTQSLPGKAIYVRCDRFGISIAPHYVAGMIVRQQEKKVGCAL